MFIHTHVVAARLALDGPRILYFLGAKGDVLHLDDLNWTDFKL